MYVNDKFVFLELQKTACSHIVKLFDKFTKGKQIGKHDFLREQDKDKLVLGSIRNPWDWYVSLWAYGCGMQGGLYKRSLAKPKLTYYLRPFGNISRSINSFSMYLKDRRSKPVETWVRLYSDNQNVNHFREWLQLIFDSERNRDFGEGFGFHPVSEYAGLLTYRYASFFMKGFRNPKSFSSLNSLDNLIAFDKSENRLFSIIRKENLEADFIKAAGLLGVELGVNEKLNILNLKKTNASKHHKTSHYYNEESYRLVEQRECFIIDKYDYSRPQ
jgi:hypothetical protein